MMFSAYGISAVMEHNSSVLKNNRVCYENEFPQKMPHDCRLLIIQFYYYLLFRTIVLLRSCGTFLPCDHVEF